MTALMATIVPRSAAGTAFETRSAAGRPTAAIGTTATTVGTATAAIRAPAAIVAATIPPATAERPLETRARIAADAGGITWEIFAWSGCTADARGASFTGKKNGVFFDDRRAFRDGFARRSCDHFRFGVGVLGIVMFLFRLCLEIGQGMIRLGFMMFTERRGVFGAFLSDVGSKFGAIDGASRLDFLGFFFREFRDRFGVNLFHLGRFLFRVVFFEFSSADDSVSFCFFGSFFMFRFGEIGG
jgi:hypothetical protein